MKVLDYLYLGVYRLLLKTGDKDIAEYSALIFLTIGLSLNVVLILKILSFEPLKYFSFSLRIFGALVCVLVGILNYFYFIQKGRYKSLLENGQNCTPKEKKINIIISIMFCIESISSPVVYALLEDAQ